MPCALAAAIKAVPEPFCACVPEALQGAKLRHPSACHYSEVSHRVPFIHIVHAQAPAPDSSGPRHPACEYSSLTFCCRLFTPPGACAGAAASQQWAGELLAEARAVIDLPALAPADAVLIRDTAMQVGCEGRYRLHTSSAWTCAAMNRGHCHCHCHLLQ